MKVRFAPSPTGHLHVGNARTALFNWLLARHGGGTFVVRIEDTDAERSTRASEAAILDDLRWMGLAWDEGLEAGGDAGPYRQSERLELYRTHAARLLDEGAAYYCFCTPEQLEADRKAMLKAGLPPKYAGTCRAIPRATAETRIAGGERPVIRMRVPTGREVRFRDLVRGPLMFHTEVIGDGVLVRSDGMPAYNFAVVVDDGLMGITHVVRGEDHISNTPRQILLYEAFGWTPPQFAHLSLVMGPDHTPLSKRHGATSVAEFRQKGYLPEALVNYLALLGWSPGDGEELLPLEELARRFDLSGVTHSASVFDEAKLAWANRHYLKAAPAGRLTDLARPFLEGAGFVTGPIAPEARTWLEVVVPVMAASVDRLDQVPSRMHTIFAFDAAGAVTRDEVRAELDTAEARAVIEAFAARLAPAPRLATREAFRNLAADVRQATGQKGRALFHPLRVALTGEPDGPELDVLVPAIEQAADLADGSGLAAVPGCRERVGAILAALG